MAHLNKFIAYLHEQVSNHSIYVWGAQGQQGAAVTEAWIKRRETSTANANRAIKYWKKQVEAGYGDILRAFDCSGLGVYFLLENGLIKFDINANGIMGKCKKIAKADLRIGDFVFKTNSSGRATHIGYVADNELNIIEAKGRDYGVTKSALKGWNVYGRPPYWTEAEVAELQGTEAPAEDKPAQDSNGYVFTRLLKFGVRGEDVCELKKLLAAAGFGG
ncbi:MAG: NlpC/P60 family protein, partial [Clostridia bacterium]|nr:NlpC/P60 family protein [Clostridia bacterium]